MSGSTSNAGGGRERLAELVRFALVGGSSTVLFMAIYTVLILVHVPYGLAQFVGWAVSLLWGFALHHRFTFRTGHSGIPQRGAGLWRWIAVQVLVMAINLLGLTLLISGLSVPKLIAQAVLLPLIPLTSYGLSRRFVFRPSAPMADGAV